MSPIKNILELRQHLAERFPAAHSFRSKAERHDNVGAFQMRDLLAGQLPKGMITELIEEKSSAGSALVLSTVIRLVCETQWIALIDGEDSFDPSGFSNELLARLLWVRCQNSDQALKAADLVLRDGNLPLVLLDLSLASGKNLGKIPATTWHRFLRIIEQSSTALLVVVPFHVVGCAQLKLSLPLPFTLEALDQPESGLLHQLEIQFEQKQFRAISEDSDVRCDLHSQFRVAGGTSH